VQIVGGEKRLFGKTSSWAWEREGGGEPLSERFVTCEVWLLWTLATGRPSHEAQTQGTILGKNAQKA